MYEFNKTNVIFAETDRILFLLKHFLSTSKYLQNQQSMQY